jgi:hypothetical protein
MTKILAIVTTLFLAGCSTTYVKTVMYKETFLEQENAFIGLVNFVRNNKDTKPTPLLKDRMNRMIFDAGMYTECINKNCYLVYSRTKVKVKFDQEYITIEYSENSYVKVEDISKAVNIIYR